ncbi:FAD/NAD(P)-binding domain-containing protein [Cadophora sp. DSE1049]|nr:FAD/NAD(P)-binding domain-containing protein [Cadophora sp. DSE1049]
MLTGYSPAYSGLMNNVPTSLQEMKGHPWPAGTESYVNVRIKQQYIQSYSKSFGIEPLIKYSTRVEKLRKVGSKWEVRSTTLIREGPRRGQKVRSVEEFDGVVVASGHYHAANIPDIPGLKEWKSSWPDQIYHSKSYRNPDELKGQTVLIIGAGVSSTDIARESHHGAKRIYQSSRGGKFDTPLDWIPPNTERVTGIANFEIPSEGQGNPGNITLTDDRVLAGVDKVIIATGYLFTLPFLVDLHDDLATPENASDTVLVTDGSQIHNLHKDIFYIPDPTLAFVGIPFYTATFTLFEYQAIAVAAVFAGLAQTPSEADMRAEYVEKTKVRGYGRSFHSLMNAQVEYVNSLVEWVNSQAETTGGAKIQGHSPEWIEESKLIHPKFLKFLETRINGHRVGDDLLPVAVQYI